MKEPFSLQQKLRDSHGIVLVWVALLLVVFISFAALAVDIGYAAVVRNELQNVGDAGALAGARQLGVIYEPMTIAQQRAYVCDPSTITSPVISVASQNQAGNLSIAVPTSDIRIGKWDATAKRFVPDAPGSDLNQPDAVEVTARRDGQANGPFSTFFAYMMGAPTLNSLAVATAALTGANEVPAGDLIPVGISWDWIRSTPNFCNQPIQFNPSNQATGCAGWNTFTNSPTSDSKLRNNILEPWISAVQSGGTYTTPGAELPLDFEFIGGQLSDPTFDAFNTLFNLMKTRDGDGDDTAWSVFLPVYDNGTGCSNPHGNLPIVGFAAAKITSVVGPPAKTIDAQVTCNLVVPDSRGGGCNCGVKGAIPGLVR